MTKETKSTEKWSLEPWKISLTRTNWIFDSANHLVAEIDGYDGAKSNAVNAARIVECVNACEGLSSSDLKGVCFVRQKNAFSENLSLKSQLAQLTAENQALKEEFQAFRTLANNNAVSYLENLSELSALKQNKSAAEKFCEGVYVETLTLMNRSGHPTLKQICEENQVLRKSLKANEDLNVAQNANLIKATHDLEALRKECEGLRACIESRDRVMQVSNEHWNLATAKIKHLWENGFFPGIEGLCDKLLSDRAELAKAREAVEWIRKWGTESIKAVTYFKIGKEGGTYRAADELRAIIGKEKQ